MTAADGDARLIPVRLDALALDGRFQFRIKLNATNVAQLATAYQDGSKPPPPIEVAMVDGVAVVVDGWHRVAALRSLRRDAVDARVRTMGVDDARWVAAMANLQHGLNLKPKERKAALRAALATYVRSKRHLKRRGSVKSFREIAEDFEGTLSHSSVRRWMYADHPKVAAKYWGAEGVGETGGLRERLQDGYASAVSDHLKNTLALFQGVTVPTERGALIAQAEAMLESMKAGGEWKIEADGFGDF
jgi:hypothetical protein